MSTDFTDAAKARKLQEYFQTHGRIYVVVNATTDDVQVPPHLHGDPALRLVINVRMPQAIYIQAEGLSSAFSFQGTVHDCYIPMKSIWAAYVPEQDLETGIMWEQDIPETIQAIMNALRKQQSEDGSIDAAIADEPDQAEVERPDREQTNTPGKRGHLRVVK